MSCEKKKKKKLGARHLLARGNSQTIMQIRKIIVAANDRMSMVEHKKGHYSTLVQTQPHPVGQTVCC